jgi:predicted ATPase
MVKCFLFENFKSFEKAELNMEAFTTLIGTNASGKSNAIEGIRILSEVVTGIDLSVILDGTKSLGGAVRGGSKSCARFKTNAFKLGCLLSYDEESDLLYEIKIGINGRIYVEEEALYMMPSDQLQPRKNKILKTKSSQTADIKVEYKNGKKGPNPDLICVRTAAVLPQMLNRIPRETDDEKMVVQCIQMVINTLKNIIVLDPVPQNMRDYTRMSDYDLRVNCDNISSVMRHMCKDKKNKQELLEIICDLPENEVSDIEFIETKIDDVIFALKEKYINSTELVDARKLSDGTLRCIAMVVAALVTAPNSILIMEEVDNGIHPGRVEKLMDSLMHIGRERNIDIIVTTHNAMLMNRYKKDQLVGVSVVYRETEKGTSKFISFVDMDDFPAILAAGGLGSAMLDNRLISSIKGEKTTKDYSNCNDY